MDNHLEAKQHLATLTTQIGKAEALAEKQQTEDSEQDRKIINYIFHKLQAICPAWQQSLAGMSHDEKEKLLKTQKREWLSSLMAAGINQRHVIDYALNCVKESGNPFLPTIGQFIGWCREGSLPEGILTPHKAYKEVTEYQCLPREQRKPQGLSPEVYHTLVSLADIHAWRHMSKDKHKEYWESEYQRTLELLRAGGQLKQAPEPVKSIEKTHTPMNKDKAINELRAMREALK